MQLPFAGVGSRKTPDPVQETLRSACQRLAELGFMLRSGGADGADKACEQGCDAGRGNKEIYLPWRNFNKNKSDLYTVSDTAKKVALYYYGRPFSSQAVEKLMGRNCYQVLGHDLRSPASFVLCWTVDGGPTGGTGQAIRVARDHDIPVFNLYYKCALPNLAQHLRQLGVQGLV